MKITDVQTVLLTGPCTNDPYLSRARQRRSAAIIEIHTDAGLLGIGETLAGYCVPEVVPSIVEFFKPIIVGQTGKCDSFLSLQDGNIQSLFYKPVVIPLDISNYQVVGGVKNRPMLL